TQDDQPHHFALTAGGNLGTPRTITSNGSYFIVGDHNAKVSVGPQGDFVWKTFPTSADQPFDFFMTDPIDRMAAWLQGDFTPDGKLVMLGRSLHIWNSPPLSPSDRPTLSITGFPFDGGDGSDIVVAGGRIYISLYNGNRVLVYNSIPTDPGQAPDFAIGSPNVCTNTLETNYFLTNGVPASNGRNLVVSSDFERKMFLWRQIPDQSGAHPDIEFFLPEGPWDNAIWGDTLVLASRRTVYIWKKIPINGELPDITLTNAIGDVSFQELRGVAVDARYFYLADEPANKVYVWEGIPLQSSNPRYILDVEQPRRLSSDGIYLAVTTTFSHAIRLYSVVNLVTGALPVAVVGGVGKFNLPENSTVASGRLFVDDTGFNRVHVWNKIEDAIAGKSADALLGSISLNDRRPQIGTNKLFWPGASCFDGSYLWVGEFKFSNRLLRFSPSSPTSVTEVNDHPLEFRLEQNYPNPFNPKTTIHFSLPHRMHVAVRVFDVLGREVGILVDGERSAGKHELVWNADGYPSGVYFCRTESWPFAEMKKMILLR
ncbi:MAG: T9SS type A sorting domain-containing protein, partial [Bacteroidota bacterium]